MKRTPKRPFTLSSALFAGRTQRREQDHVADGVAVGEQHYHAVDTDAQTCGRRQAVLQRGDVVFIEEHRFVVARVFRFHLLTEAIGLIFRIVQLGETVADFAAADKEFKAVGDFRVGVVAARQRRNFCRIFGDKGRLDKMAFRGLFKNLSDNATRAPAFLYFDAQRARNGDRFIEIIQIGR